MTIKITGQGRVVLRDVAHPEKIVKDTGWVSNVVTDTALLTISDNISMADLDVFIHESAAPGRANRTLLPFTYADQTPSQIRNPDVIDTNEATGISIFTVQFPVPTIARDINTVGLTRATSVASVTQQVVGIVAYTSLTTTVSQGTSQTADVQYRLTWSFQ